MTSSLASPPPTSADAARELLRRRAARSGMLAFTEYTYGEYSASWHHRLLCRKLDAFVVGKIPRMMVFMPPRHGKSELCSRRLPPYLLGRSPDEAIIACSNTSSLASDMNRDCQRVMDSLEYQRLFPETQLSGRNNRTTGPLPLRNSEVFEVVNHRGRYHAAGVGQSIVGRGFGVGIIDDPFSSREEADSPVMRESVWKWYTGDFYTRRGPGARILLINTRWHPEDLAGRLLRLAEEDPSADQWEVLSLPAVREVMGHPEDPRKEGEALWPDRYPLSELKKTKAASPYDWDSQYQQRPRSPGSVDWPEEYFSWPGFWFDEWPDNCHFRVMSLDPSKGRESKTGDWQVIIKWGRTPDGTEYVEADVAKRPPAAIRAPDGTALTEGMCETCIEIYRTFRPEALAVEANVFQELLAIPLRAEAKRRNVEDLNLMLLNNTVNKLVRIRRLGDPLSRKVMRFRRTQSTRLLVEQLKQFPTADHDDGPDALEMARRTAIELHNNRQPKPRRR